jgi:hypothetical protein
MNSFRFPASFLFYSFSGISGLFPFCGYTPSARKMSFHGPGEFMEPQLFFSVRHGLQQLQSLHDGGEEGSSPVSGPDLQNSPSPVRHYFPNHGVEEKPKAFRHASLRVQPLFRIAFSRRSSLCNTCYFFTVIKQHRAVRKRDPRFSPLVNQQGNEKG